ncbi:hypothetical protein NL379_26560, partial [Klebsiella pneumoniae]|nr:hypothetical protein [Klebsiella pneumoniae]
LIIVSNMYVLRWSDFKVYVSFVFFCTETDVMPSKARSKITNRSGFICLPCRCCFAALTYGKEKTTRQGGFSKVQ